MLTIYMRISAEKEVITFSISAMIKTEMSFGWDQSGLEFDSVPNESSNMHFRQHTKQ